MTFIYLTKQINDTAYHRCNDRPTDWEEHFMVNFSTVQSCFSQYNLNPFPSIKSLHALHTISIQHYHCVYPTLIQIKMIRVVLLKQQTRRYLSDFEGDQQLCLSISITTLNYISSSCHVRDDKQSTCINQLGLHVLSLLSDYS